MELHESGLAQGHAGDVFIQLQEPVCAYSFGVPCDVPLISSRQRWNDNWQGHVKEARELKSATAVWAIKILR